MNEIGFILSLILLFSITQLLLLGKKDISVYLWKRSCQFFLNKQNYTEFQQSYTLSPLCFAKICTIRDNKVIHDAVNRPPVLTEFDRISINRLWALVHISKLLPLFKTTIQVNLIIYIFYLLIFHIKEKTKEIDRYKKRCYIQIESRPRKHISSCAARFTVITNCYSGCLPISWKCRRISKSDG